MTLPPRRSTLDEYSSTDSTSMKLVICCCGDCLFPIPPPRALFPLSSTVDINQYSILPTNQTIYPSSTQTDHYRTFLIFRCYLRGYQNVLLLAYSNISSLFRS